MVFLFISSLGGVTLAAKAPWRRDIIDEKFLVPPAIVGSLWSEVWVESENDPYFFNFSPLPNSQRTAAALTVHKGEIQGWICGHLAVSVKTKWLTGSIC